MTDDLARRLLAAFVLELDDGVPRLERVALALDAGAPAAERAALLEEGLRTLHTLKGAARSAAVGPVEAGCHALEEVLARAREGEGVVGLVERLLAGVDALRTAAADRAAGRPLDPAPLAALGRPPAGAAALAAPQEAPVVDLGVEASVRVPTTRVDRLLALAGELLVARTGLDARWGELDAVRGGVAAAAAQAPPALKERLRGLEREVERLAAGVRAGQAALHGAAGALEDGLEGLRMLPFEELAPGLDRTAREAARDAGKEVELSLRGERAQIDRVVLHALQGPLRHLVRNAVDHGLEAPDRRRALGKPPRGRVVVEAAVRGAHVDVVVTDDGAGVDLDAVRERARALGLAPPAGEGEEAALLGLLFRPGFTTARSVTGLSGRGVGLDVVAREVGAVHGRVAVRHTPGQGVRVTIAVPVTLATLRVVLVTVGGQTFALPETVVERLVRLAPGDLRSVGGGLAAAVEGEVLDVLSLARVLDLPEAPTSRPGERRLAALVAAGDRRALVLVDGLEGELEAVVKGLGRRVRRLRHVVGVTLLADGRLVPILGGAGLGERLRAPAGRAPALLVEPRRRPRVVLAEDSLTTRTLEESILITAGYEVLAAPDGEEAWRLLQERGADAVVADVQMPRLDGLGLTRRVRASRRHRDLPVVLVTGLGSDEDRRRGLEAGASAYVVKSAFDQRELLATLERLTGGPP
ncbi:MAG: response regulator [Planctomycetes bacterium]|nr:response regulator [Planctomycetota bacterium]